ncbi:MAG: hypothetical protein KJZ69_08190 [Phycisphaerales bacterium]|nr:hypothetical protein [Phycisphaerales bacterium]
MMPVSWILGYLLLTGVLAVGGLHTFRRARTMWRTAILADLPYCDACAPSSAVESARPAAVAGWKCTRCHRTISGKETIRTAPAPRRPNAGFAHCFASYVLISANIAFTLWWFPSVIWHRFVPLNVLLVEQRLPVPFASHWASDELTRKILDDNRGLPDDVRQRLVEAALTRQAQVDRRWDERMGQIVDAAWYKGLMDDDQIQQWVEQLFVAEEAIIEPRPPRSRKDGFSIELRFRRRGSDVLPFDFDLTIESASLNGESLPEFQSSSSGRALDEFHFEKYVEESGSMQTTNRLECVCRFDYIVPGEQRADRRTWRRAYELEFTWQQNVAQVVAGSLREKPLEEVDH